METLLALIFGGIASFLQEGTGGNLSRRIKFLISMGACVVAGGLATGYNLLQSGTFDYEQILANIGTAFLASQALYNTYFKPKETKDKGPDVAVV